MRISDWSSDVCSSDLLADQPFGGRVQFLVAMRGRGNRERYQVQCFLFIAVVGKIAETLDLRIRPDDLAGFDAFRQLPFELGRNARVTGIDRKSTRLNSSH